jgi:hypothetical protein
MAVSPFGLLPFNQSIYLSRVSEFQSRPANYVLTGFRPGFALQAAELNELQEQFMVYQTLSMRTFNNWRDTVLTNPNPFWDGTTPFDPDLLTVTSGSGFLDVSINPGWYYLVDTTNNVTSGILNSGFGYWINIKTAQSIRVTFAETSSTPIRFGFTYTVSDIGSATDNTLLDNSNAANASMTIPGANRIKINNITLAKFATGMTKFSEIFGAIRVNTSSFKLAWPYNAYSQLIATGNS